MSARVSDWLADSCYVSQKLERLSAKQKTRRGWLQPPDWSAKSKITTRWLCHRLVSSKRCQQSKKLDAGGWSKAKNSTRLAPATRLVSKMQNLDALALPQISQLQTT